MSDELCTEAVAEIDRLRARITELEAELAALTGSVAKPAADEPTNYAHNVPPNAPPHDELSHE